ncbi:hypothetical protein GLOIN_2v1844403 [Rhizophagus irregularis DAOM 181602=DAOM 197198]|nr:hypothetical protein GLOIN_2v1844403 [Rhizophagus irregularis DAOM 181602=DAOM 197198]
MRSLQQPRTARECQKILKQVAEERTKHEAENAELRSRIEELENGRMDTVAECEKADMSGEKSLEDKKTDASLDEVHKWVDTCEAKVDVIKANREFKSLSLHRKSKYGIPDDDDQTAASEAQTNPLVSAEVLQQHLFL